MSESFNVQTVSLTLGAFSGATEVPLYRVPLQGGGITVVDAWAYQNGTNGSAATSGTSIGAKLVTFGTVGSSLTANGTVPSLAGTIGNFIGTIVTGPGTVHTCTIGTPYVGPGYFIGFDETSGTLAAGLTIQIAYVLGKDRP